MAITISICILAFWEWCNIAGLVSSYRKFYLSSIFFITLLGIVLIFIDTDDVALKLLNLSLWIAVVWWIFAMLLVIFYPISSHFWHHSSCFKISFGALTILFFFIGMLALRWHNYDTEHRIGSWLILFTMFQVWSIDSGSYLCGKVFGKRKLSPKISPNKTWEGVVGGFIFSFLPIVVFNYYLPHSLSTRESILCALIMTLVSVIGDLSESMFKRVAGVKDSGNIIPGHGGILDRIDSLMAAIPISAILLLNIYHIL
jgi:phosphatidate cytidylyltransferase